MGKARALGGRVLPRPTLAALLCHALGWVVLSIRHKLEASEKESQLRKYLHDIDLSASLGGAIFLISDWSGWCHPWPGGPGVYKKTG